MSRFDKYKSDNQATSTQIANVNSSCTIYKHLLHLKDKGYIDYVSNKSRTIKILKGVD